MNIALIGNQVLMLELMRNSLDTVFPESCLRIYIDEEALLKQVYRDWSPDIVICYLTMPSIGGLEVLEALSDLAQGMMRLIILSNTSDTAAFKEYIRFGAFAYLSKESAFKELVEAINTIMNGRHYVSNDISRSLFINGFHEDEIFFQLTSREIMVLSHICQGLSPKEIASTSDNSIHTINQHIRSLKKKFKVTRATDIMLFVIKNGLHVGTK